MIQGELVAQFGIKTDDFTLYDKIVEAGIWKRNTFKKDFEKAMKSLTATKNSFENAQVAYVEIITKNGNLVNFTKKILAD